MNEFIFNKLIEQQNEINESRIHDYGINFKSNQKEQQYPIDNILQQQVKTIDEQNIKKRFRMLEEEEIEKT